MLQFQSHVVAAASTGVEALQSLNQEDHLGSLDMISTPYHSPWVNPTSSSSSLGSVLFDDRPLDLSEIDIFVNQMGCLDSWASLEKSHEIARPLKTAEMQTSDAACDPQLNVLNDLVKKCNSTEDLFYGEVNPHGSFLQDVTRPLNNAPGYNLGPVIQQDSFGSVVNSEPREATENDIKEGVLKLPAKRSIGARTAQLRPNKRGALHHKSGEMEISQREIHIQSERERRKGMNNLFERMRALLPSPNQKVDKSTVVSEIINYIQSLQQNLEDLNKKRAKTVSSPGAGTAPIKTEPVNCAESIQSRCTDSDSPPSLSLNEESTKQAPQVALHFNGNDIFITICCSHKANLLPAIIYVVEDHKLQIMCANVSRTDTVAFHCLHVKALDTPGTNIKQALRDSLKKLVCLDNQIRM
ncbi:hypothetical protein SUGI_0454020 [Cryptomeria japonica]|uniref:transcription factor MTB1 n=1 Tax=Cryptomeria japonica TaxID=3369 RepID=UPI002408E5B8|nr:transcription factor MTB1 [Cryptomeria japonica]GLJ23892.1 hypothetical protein SUGI_0454020 [Cryptomeria japonica]